MRTTRRALALAGTTLLALSWGSGLPASAGPQSEQVFVAGNAGWVATGVQGDGAPLDITASGQVMTFLWPPSRGGSLSGPDGQDPFECVDQDGFVCALDGAGAYWGVLIGKFGVNGAPFLIGSSETVSGTGELMLAANDYIGYWSDNRGGYSVKVRHL